jgi:hypothetical protein
VNESFFEFLPVASRSRLTTFFADAIELANDESSSKWGTTPYESPGFRLNVGFIEIITAFSSYMRILVDVNSAQAASEETGVPLQTRDPYDCYYPAVKTSRLVELGYEPAEEFEQTLTLFRPAVFRLIEQAAKGGRNHGMITGHRSELVCELARLTGRALPLPEYADTGSQQGLPSTPPNPAPRAEGASYEVTLTIRERDPNAREACLRAHGLRCAACGLSFEERYGEIGAGYIQVHHEIPLSSLKRPTVPDPVAEMKPVCPNCHAMLHRESPPITIARLRDLLAEHRPPS